MGIADWSREREMVNRVQLDVNASTTGNRRAAHQKSLHQAMLSTGTRTKCIGCQHAKLGLKPAGHIEE